MEGRNMKEDGWTGGRDEGIKGKDRRIRVGTYGLKN
jgi:predicted transcriptional regulator